MSIEMNKLAKNIAFAVFVAGAGLTMTSPAFAISSAEECKAAVQEVTRDLLKANVNNDALGDIDAALVAADTACASDDYATADTQLNKARTMIKAAAQN